MRGNLRPSRLAGAEGDSIMNRMLAAALFSTLFPAAAVAQSSTAPATPPPTVPQAPYSPDFTHLVEGQTLETRKNENDHDKPAFPGQTRAPYHKTQPYKLTEITSKLYAPWGMAFLPDGKFLVTEKMPGRFRIVSPAGAISMPLAGLDALGVTWSETGLIDIVQDPDFGKNHRFYFTYFAFDHGMIGGINVARATLDEAGNALRDVTTIWRSIPSTPYDAHTGYGSRSGGRMVLGPKDGYLYVILGDRDAGTSTPWRVAQTLDTRLGKVVRITRDGKPAPGNPFTATPGALPEIWAIGGRSQEGLAFDSKGQLWETEHGPRGGDELNLIKKGANYDWPQNNHNNDYPGPVMGDGSVSRAGIEEPVYYWAPSLGPSGLAFYDANLFPQWKGSVLVGMLRGNTLLRLTLKNDKVVDEEPLLMEVKMRIRDVRVGPDGAVYVLTDSGGGSITDNTPQASKLLKLTPQ